jgi:hypothetical protein
MSLEQKLIGWTGPSSDTEQEKQERTERMVREAIQEHPPLRDCALRVYAKGSYANNTNVRGDSDVDIAVECTEAMYWGEAAPGAHPPLGSYTGLWTPARLRDELGAALMRKFGNAVDASGSTALQIHSSSTRVDADVVPCFSYRYYFSPNSSRVGTKIFKKDGSSIVNYPAQQLENGKAKNLRTGYVFKKATRVLKRVENAMVQAQVFGAVPSYLIECLAYNCPDPVFSGSTWTETMRAALVHIWNSLDGEEPTDSADRWREVNDCFYLFHSSQRWTRVDGRSFAHAAWNYLGLS